MTLLTSLWSSCMSAQRDQGEADAELGTGQPTGDIEGFDLTPEESQEERSQQPWPRCRCHCSGGPSLKCRPGSRLCSRRALGDEKSFGWGGGEQKQVACLRAGARVGIVYLKARPTPQTARTGTDRTASRYRFGGELLRNAHWLDGNGIYGRPGRQYGRGT